MAIISPTQAAVSPRRGLRPARAATIDSPNTEKASSSGDWM